MTSKTAKAKAKIPGLFTAVIQPKERKDQAQARAKQMVRSASHSFKSTPKDAAKNKGGVPGGMLSFLVSYICHWTI